MNSICLNFRVHLPYYYKKYHFFDIGVNHDYYDTLRCESEVKRVSERCYLPANKLMMTLLERYPERFSFSLAISVYFLAPSVEQQRFHIIFAFAFFVFKTNIELHRARSGTWLIVAYHTIVANIGNGFAV